MKNTKRIALCGMFGALSVTIMLLGSIFPFATYMYPAIAAFFILPIVYEYKEKTGFMLYLVVSILSVLLVAEKEFAFIYIFIFGLYSVFKFRMDIIKPKIVQYLLKSLFCLVMTAVCYGLLLFVFSSPVLTEDFGDFTLWLGIAFAALFTVTFLLFDFASSKMFILYRYYLRPKLIKK
ncbi:MAG: hypothetical protein IKA10_09245 [Oscillospiraceae bacterium]|nr:hypothetical protein [Oscillospiraceae bacterium]